MTKKPICAQMLTSIAIASVLSLGLMGSVSANEESEMLSKEANSLWAQSKQDEAEKVFLSAIDKDPEDASVRRYLGSFYLSQKENGKAVDQFKEGVMIEPENANFFVGLAIAYLHQSSYNAAHAMAGRALTLDPELKQAKKLQEYISVKQEVLQRASDLDVADSGEPVPSHVKAPTGHN